MRLRIISSKEEIGKLDSAEELVHLTFRPSNTDVVALITACPNLLVVHIPNSYKKNDVEVSNDVSIRKQHQTARGRSARASQGYRPVSYSE
ncbi:MAG: DUF1699 family protein [Euryarchaeota archaeon]|nr:DUF1699 family protein [Euryarchaeota archaeon]